MSLAQVLSGIGCGPSLVAQVSGRGTVTIDNFVSTCSPEHFVEVCGRLVPDRSFGRLVIGLGLTAMVAAAAKDFPPESAVAKRCASDVARLRAFWQGMCGSPSKDEVRIMAESLRDAVADGCADRGEWQLLRAASRAFRYSVATIDGGRSGDEPTAVGEVYELLERRTAQNDLLQSGVASDESMAAAAATAERVEQLLATALRAELGAVVCAGLRLRALGHFSAPRADR